MAKKKMCEVCRSEPATMFITENEKLLDVCYDCHTDLQGWENTP